MMTTFDSSINQNEHKNLHECTHIRNHTQITTKYNTNMQVEGIFYGSNSNSMVKMIKMEKATMK